MLGSNFPCYSYALPFGEGKFVLSNFILEVCKLVSYSTGTHSL